MRFSLGALVSLHICGCTGAPTAEPTPTPIRSADGASLAFTWEEHGEVALTGAARGEGELQVSVAVVGGAFVPTVTAGPEGAVLEGVVFTGTWALADGAGEAVLWRQGYQSWSWSGVTELGAPTVEDGVPLAAGDGDVETIAQETSATSWWAGLVGVPGGDALLVGATGVTRTKFYVAFSETEAWAVYGMRGERIPLAAGESITLDPLSVEVGGDAHGLWKGWAAEVPARTPTRGAWVGWSDWYQYYGEASEADLLDNLDAAANLDDSHAPIEVFQVDDGWEVAWGEWETNERFPSGSAGFAAEIAAAGMVPGLWMAPFYVARSTDTYAANADWWVRDANGDELTHGRLSGNDYAILDITHPDAAAWLRGQIAAKVADGWAYLKLDFLYAGAVEGVRHDNVTGAEAYRLGMALLRSAMGEDTWFLACGAPMLPSVGYADSWRSGADIAFDVDPDPRRPYLRWQARSTAARAFANGIWWWNDADNLLLRAPFTDGEARGAIAANVASGGVWLLGDAFAALDPARLAGALDPDVVSLAGLPTTPRDPLAFVSGFDAGPFMEAGVPDDEAPTAWTIGDDATVLLNLGDLDAVVEGPGGTDLLSGETAAAGPRTLAPGAGEVWVR
ncbi:MAG: alpha-galactosidase [Pseudomonadota bacterium]|nr:alpha-galactosidase [Pseudomonadota bacterium]